MGKEHKIYELRGIIIHNNECKTRGVLISVLANDDRTLNDLD